MALLNPKDSYEQLKRKNRRRLVGAMVMVTAATVLLLNVLNQNKEPTSQSQEVVLTGLNMADTVLVVADSSDVAASMPLATTDLTSAVVLEPQPLADAQPASSAANSSINVPAAVLKTATAMAVANKPEAQPNISNSETSGTKSSITPSRNAESQATTPKVVAKVENVPATKSVSTAKPDQAQVKPVQSTAPSNTKPASNTTQKVLEPKTALKTETPVTTPKATVTKTVPVQTSTSKAATVKPAPTPQAATPKTTPTQAPQAATTKSTVTPTTAPKATTTKSTATPAITPKAATKTTPVPTSTPKTTVTKTTTAPKTGKLSPQEILNNKASTQAQTAAKSNPQAILDGQSRSDRALIQVGAYTSEAQAREVQQKLGSAGVSAHISQSQTSKGVLYRVRTGTYASRDQAEQNLNRIRTQGLDGMVIGQ